MVGALRHGRGHRPGERSPQVDQGRGEVAVRGEQDCLGLRVVGACPG